MIRRGQLIVPKRKPTHIYQWTPSPSYTCCQAPLVPPADPQLGPHTYHTPTVDTLSGKTSTAGQLGYESRAKNVPNVNVKESSNYLGFII